MNVKRLVWRTAIAIPLVLFLGVAVAYWRSDNDCEARRAMRPVNPMKAIAYCDYGAADVLKLEDVEKPAPGDDEILVKVRAASVNPLDWHFMRGTPYLARATMGLRRPESTALGVDFAGTVESVGRNVSAFKPGDDVFGGKTGAFAEYVTIRAAGSVVLKPARLTFEQAAAIPVAAITALQGLRDGGKLQSGQTVLINGASGGVGTFAVQIARSFGARITGVCSTRNVEMVRSLGAHDVVDYTKEDFVQRPERYDVVLDNVGNRSLAEFRRVLKPQGIYVMIGGGGVNEQGWIGPLGRPAQAFLLRPFVSQDMGLFIAHLDKKDLTVLGDLMQAGTVTPVIDRRFPLSEVPAAIRYLEDGHARGKVIITME
jgi:NADPH:quinone reductase-like Zn-dependent oxidoreductase